MYRKFLNIIVIVMLALGGFAACQADKSPLQQDNLDEVDLSGNWHLRLLYCLAGEAKCQKRLSNTERSWLVQQPENLRSRFPWFVGTAQLSKTFQYYGELKDNVLLIGALGSIDQISVNGKSIGFSGVAKNDKVLHSTWNLVRYYQVDAHLMRYGKNLIEIEFTSVDPFMGLYRGPIKLGSKSHLYYEYLLWSFVYNQIHIISFGLLAFALLYFLLIYLLQKPGNHYLNLLLGVAPYILYAIYFVEMPPFGNHLVNLKIYFTGKWISYSIFGTFLLVEAGFKWRRIGIFNYIITSLFVVIWFVDSYNELFTVLQIMHFYFFANLFVVNIIIFFKRKELDPQSLKVNWPGLWIASVTYFVEFLIMTYVITWPWIFHYLILIFIILIIIFYSFRLFAWQEKALEYKVQSTLEQIRISREIHDTVGAELTRLIFQTTDPQSKKIAKETLEKLKDIIFVLRKDKKEISSIKDFIVERTDFLYKSGKYSLDLQLEDLDLSDLENIQLQKIFSEWFSNVLRHSAPAQVQVKLLRRKHKNYLLVKDDGQGFRWNGNKNESGLANIKMRVDSLQGTVWSRRTGSGTLFFCKF